MNKPRPLTCDCCGGEFITYEGFDGHTCQGGASTGELAQLRAELERTTKYYERSMEQVNVMRAALERLASYPSQAYTRVIWNIISTALESASEATQAEGAGEKTK